MKDLLNKMLAELDVEKSVEHVKWLTDNTPNRLSGGGQDLKAAEYICEKMKEYGLESQILDFEAYNSHPGKSEVKVLYPENTTLKSLPCGHINSTPIGGMEFEVIYLGSGGEEDYVGKDVEGKAVLVEVSYAPATPEKAMLASEHGAAAMICMNWGKPEKELICNRALKAVWGNPTPESFEKIPQLAGVSVTRKDGEYLRELCLNNDKVVINIDVQSSREWMHLPQPLGILRGTEEPEKFLLVSAHLDAWCPGVTCNATGDATMLEMARVFGKYKDEMKRSIYFVYWNGHEIAEAAGSTWFNDYFYEDVRDNCIGYINIDSTGMLDASIYIADSSRELYDFTLETITDILQEEIRVNYLAKTGDQSFFGVGVPSIAGRVMYSDEVVADENGATLGYWNHTIEDGIDKMSVENLEKDNRVDVGVLLGLTNAEVLPYNFEKTCEDMAEKVAFIKAESGNIISLDKIQKKIEELTANVEKLNELIKKGNSGDLNKDVVKKLNDTLLRLSRSITNAFYTNAEKYDQDSYGRTILSKPLPLLYPMTELAKMDSESLEYKLLYTKMLKNRNRVYDAVSLANEYVSLFLD